MMIIVKPNGQRCDECGSFTKKFVLCEACHKKMCARCAANESYCIECLASKQHNEIVDEYYREKYAKV
jgi:hypothetical protein